MPATGARKKGTRGSEVNSRTVQQAGTGESAPQCLEDGDPDAHPNPSQPISQPFPQQ